VVVGGTFHAVERAPVGPFGALVAIPLGMADAASVIFLVFLFGGAFAVVERTGALRAGLDWLIERLPGEGAGVIVVVSLFFAAGGALSNTAEEVVGVMPVLLLLVARLGYDRVTAVAMSLGAAGVAAAFSPMNPFQVGLAQKVADVPLLSGWEFRTVLMAVGLTIWIFATVRYATRIQKAPSGDETPAPANAPAPNGDEMPAPAPNGGRHGIVLAIFAGCFAVYAYGVLGLGWDFEQMSGLFFGMGIVAGLVGGLGIAGTASAFVDGFRSMTTAAMMIGVARAIYVVLEQGRVVDTIVHGMFLPLADLPVALSAVGMMGAQVLIHIPVSSVSGQAVLTMPVVAPLADLLGMSRQIGILAYQCGAGICDIATPTNGALVAVLAAAGVRYDEWVRFAAPLWVALLALGAVAILAGLALGLA